MRLFNSIKSGQLSIDGFTYTLRGYEAQKATLISTKSSYGPDLYNSKMNDLNMSIGMVQLFIDNYKTIKQSKRE